MKLLVLSLLPFLLAGQVRINAGGPAYTDASGTWAADTFVTGGDVATAPIAPGVPQMYFTHRYGDFTYQIPVPDGQYTVALYMMEQVVGPGARIFSVTINGAAVLARYDLALEAGMNVGVRKQFPATAAGGTGITIKWTTIQRSATVSAIEVLPVATPPTGLGSYTIAFTLQRTVTVPGTVHKLGQALIASCYDATGLRLPENTAGTGQPLNGYTMAIDQTTGGFDVAFAFPGLQSGYCVMLGGAGSRATAACLAWIIQGEGPAVSACKEGGYVGLGGPVSAKAGDVIRLYFAVTGNPDTGASGFQWTLKIPAGYVATAAPGPPAIASGKQVSCVNDSSSSKCVMSGPDAAVIPNGDVVIYSVQVPPTAAGTTAVFTLTEWLGATKDGDRAPAFESFNLTVAIV